MASADVATMQVDNSASEATSASAATLASQRAGLRPYYNTKLDELDNSIREKTTNLRRLEAQRNNLNTKGEWTFHY